ncbi:MAG: DUF6206 family protein [Desulfobacterales bacterium]|jgi:hypothetical protein
MNIDQDLLYRFEKGLNPQNLRDSAIGAEIVGYGEISAIFKIRGIDGIVLKRMPLFSDLSSAECYTGQYYEYCSFLEDAGLKLPAHDTCIIQVPGRPVILYIAQQLLKVERFCHRLVHQLKAETSRQLIEGVVAEIAKVWAFNQTKQPYLELAIDGQLSNWVCPEENGRRRLYYVDTSTPLYRKNGMEQLNPELILQSAPAFLRWFIRLIFLDDVMERYYQHRLVFTDLAANLFKEQKQDLIPPTVAIINRYLQNDTKPLTLDEVKRYYREDKLIWIIFLLFRRIDRWLTTRIFRKRYEFILPGKIKR